MDLSEFLSVVVTVPEGWFCLPLKLPSGEWHETWFQWPLQKQAIIEAASELKNTGDVYFSSYLFSSKQSTKANVILDGHRTIQCDLDNANPATSQFPASVLVSTSNKRYQGYWILSEPHYDIEGLSRKVTYSILDADKSGWWLGHKVRLPTTFNYKYGAAQPVVIVTSTVRAYFPSELDTLPTVEPVKAKADRAYILGTNAAPDLEIGPNELLETVKGKIPSTVYNGYNIIAKDRSAALWALMCALFRAGMDRHQVLYLAHNSANNKWPTLPKELAKDVLRAEEIASDISNDAKEIINHARKSPGTAAERDRLIFNVALTVMNSTGTFANTRHGAYFTQHRTGNPIPLSRAGEQLQTLIGNTFGLNPTEHEHQYVAAGLTVYGRAITAQTEVGSLSYYDERVNTMLLHTGRKDVIKITSDSVETISNGNGVLFPWIPDCEPYYPVLGQQQSTWADEMFSIRNGVDLTPDEASALLRCWFLFLLFRQASSARPVLALLGQPGSGKTTTGKKLYSLIYGSRKKISIISNTDAFDNTVSTNPFVLFDNADTYKVWLPDAIAQMAAATDSQKRKLYTDNDTFIMQRDAMIALTAHNPRFLRPDVVDRLVLINLARYPDTDFMVENELIYGILRKRNILWGQVVNDIQLILNEPHQHDTMSHMRISDYVSFGEWFARALGIMSQFTSGLRKIHKAQKTTDLEEEQMLVSALVTYANKSSTRENFKVPGQLWVELALYSGDALTFQRLYRNAPLLGRKLWSLQDALKEVLDIEWEQGPIRTWRIRPKDS